MFNILIVDDDKLIREDIKTLINWQEHGFEVVGEAGNGMEAVNIINSTHVDLVVTDIYMPIMNGIELIKCVRKSHPEIKFLVISNYDDFSYVKEAMKLGASDYILKYEIEKSNLISLLDNFKMEIEKEEKTRTDISNIIVMSEKAREYLVEQFWKRVLEGQLQKTELEEQAGKLNICLREGVFALILVDLIGNNVAVSVGKKAMEGEVVYELPEKAREAAENIKDCNIVPMSENRWIILVNHMEKSFSSIRSSALMTATAVKDALENSDEFKAVVTVGGTGKRVNELSEEYIKLKRIAEDRFYSGMGIVIDSATCKGFINEFSEEATDSFRKVVLHAISMNDSSSASGGLKEYFEYIRENRFYPELVYNSLIDLYMGISNQVKEKGINNVKNVYGGNDISYREFSRFKTLRNIEDYFIQILDNVFKFGLGTTLQSRRPETVKAIEFINTSYMNDLSLNDVADHVGLSKNYFCRLFKEETGENFIDYLNRLRVEKAKYILENKSCKALEVAYDVGIRDYRYFCKVFKQVTGKRPNEYKKQVKG